MNLAVVAKNFAFWRMRFCDFETLCFGTAIFDLRYLIYININRLSTRKPPVNIICRIMEESIREQVKNNFEKIAKTKVIILETTEVDFRNVIQQVRENLTKKAGFVRRKDFGKIQVASRLHDGVKYLKTKAEKMAIALVADVIERGVIIHTRERHKDRAYGTTTFARLVSVNGKSGIMAVVVKKTRGFFYQVHRVLNLDGDDLKL